MCEAYEAKELVVVCEDEEGLHEAAVSHPTVDSPRECIIIRNVLSEFTIFV
jgi:hypothetical protein